MSDAARRAEQVGETAVAVTAPVRRARHAGDVRLDDPELAAVQFTADMRPLVVDGSNLGKIGARQSRPPIDLAVLREALSALRHQFPGAQIVTVVDRHEAYRQDVSAASRAAVQQAFASGEFAEPPKGVKGGADGFILSMAEQHGAVVVSNDAYKEFVPGFPWLTEGGRLLGANRSLLGWTFPPCVTSRTRQRGASRRDKSGDATPARSDRPAESFAQILARFRALEGVGGVVGDARTELSLHHAPEAHAAAEQWITEHPASHGAWSALGRTLLHLQRFAEALGAAERSISLEPTDPEAWSLKARAHDQLRRYDEALVAVDHALSLRADHLESWRVKTRLLVLLRQYEEALTAEQHCHELDPDKDECCGLDADTLVDAQSMLARDAEDPSGWSLMITGLRAFGAWEDALIAAERLRSTARQRPPSFQLDYAWQTIADCHVHLGQRDDALAALDTRISLTHQSDLLEPLWFKTALLVALGREEEARVVARLHIGEPTMSLYSSTAAVETANRVHDELKVSGLWARAYAAHLRVHERALVERIWSQAASAHLSVHEEALAEADNRLATLPDDTEAIHIRAAALIRLGRYEEGLAAAEKATALWPTDPDGWVCTIAASRHLGRGTGTALEIANALVARHPDLPAAWEGLSDILYRFDRFDESLKALVSWERLAPGCADALRTRSARIREATRSGQPGEPDWVRNSRGPSDER